MSQGICARVAGLLASVLVLTSCSGPVAPASLTPVGPQRAVATYGVEEVQQLRKDAGTAARLAGRYPNGWSKSTDDPARLLAAFPTLRLKKGLVLRAYVFREGGNGNGVIWAMPEQAAFPDPAELRRVEGGLRDLPRPQGATGIMQGIDGDGSPWSYLSASLLAREAQDFAAQQHGVGWGLHRFVGADPWAGRQTPAEDPMQGPTGKLPDWKWSGPRPADWAPRVEMAGDRVTVTFYTYTPLGYQRIFRHVDTYRPGQYDPESQDDEIGSGPPGIVV